MSILYNVIINGKLLYICICNAVKEGDYERYNLIGTSCGECMKTNYEERKMNIMMLEENVNKELTRADVVELLQNDVAQVTFTKTDGSERVMDCTLLKEVLDDRAPQSAPDAPAKPPKKVNPDVVPVFDIVANGWRSFRLDAVKSIGFPQSIFTDDGIVYPTLETQ